MTALDFSTILPELVLAIFALGALMAGAYFGKDALARPILWATVAALLLVGLYVGFADRPQVDWPQHVSVLNARHWPADSSSHRFTAW